MRAWLHQGGGAASGLLVVDAETGRSVCASAPEHAAAAGLEHEAVHDRRPRCPARARSADPDQGLRATARSTPTASCTAASTCRAAATPRSARRPSTTRYLGGLGTNLFSLTPQIRAAGIEAVTGRLYADDTIFDRLRGVADSGYATSPYIGPLSGLAFNSGFSGSTSASGFSSDPAKLAAAKLARSLRAAGRRDPAAGRPAADAGRAPNAVAAGPLADASTRSSTRPTSTPTTSSPRC